MQRKKIADGEKKIQDAQDEIDDISMPEWMVTDRNDLPEYSDADFEELLNKIEEGFFPESSIAACEPAIQEEKKRRKKLKSTPASDQDEVTDDEEEQDESKNRHARKTDMEIESAGRKWMEAE